MNELLFPAVMVFLAIGMLLNARRARQNTSRALQLAKSFEEQARKWKDLHHTAAKTRDDALALVNKILDAKQKSS